MVVSVTQTSQSTPASASSQSEALEVRNIQALVLEGLQQLPITQQKFILDLVELFLERLEMAGEADEELPSAVESFRLGWEDVLKGDTVPLAQLWDSLEDE